MSAPLSARFVRRLCAALLAALLLPASASRADDHRPGATVSHLEGGAKVSAGGRTEASALELGARVYEGDVVETAAAARLELKLADGSVIRVGPSSKVELKSAWFGDKGEKRFSARLVFGRVWSKVIGLVGTDSKFEIETDNAVAGVRGTTFRVDASTDKSVLVRVYAGAVAMAPSAAIAQQTHQTPTPKSQRRQVAGPQEVSRQTWETLVGRMMQLVVNADGTPGEATAFTLQDEAGDEWAAWNRMMDAR